MDVDALSNVAVTSVEPFICKFLIGSTSPIPTNPDDVEKAMQSIKHELQTTGEREVSSQLIGEFVMKALRKLDQVAFVRFASIYRSFEDVKAFRDEILRLESED